jgi:hypothetical protein
MTIEQIQLLCLAPLLLLSLWCLIAMEVGFHSCDRCGKVRWKVSDYGYAGMNYCPRCAKKEGY